MSLPTTVHSSHLQGYVCKIYNLSPAGVADLTGCIGCGDFIAAGGSGQIFKGKWKKPNRLNSLRFRQPVLPNVVVKLISVPVLTDEKEKDRRFKMMKREVELWKQINHRNILPLVGIARIDGDHNRPALISPWMEYGNVPDFLKQNPTFPAVSFLHDIIEGLHFLHTFIPEIIHGDIKAVNALVNHRKEAYLCDFGLSRIAVDNTLWRTTATHAHGTLRWMAPELLEGEACISTKASDIYAYGMTCYEILSGKVPFDTARTDPSVMRKVSGGHRPERITSCHPDGIWSIVERCWAQNAEERPSVEEVRRSVVQFIEGSDGLKERIQKQKTFIGIPKEEHRRSRPPYRSQLTNRFPVGDDSGRGGDHVPATVLQIPASDYPPGYSPESMTPEVYWPLKPTMPDKYGKISRKIYFDVALDPRENDRRDLYDQGIRRFISREELDFPAVTHCTLTDMIIIHSDPRYAIWPIKAHREGGLRCIDVFGAIYDTFHKPVRDEDSFTEEEKLSSESYRQIRCQNTPRYSWGEGLLRVDILQECRIFVGLEQNDTTWKLYLAPYMDVR